MTSTVSLKQGPNLIQIRAVNQDAPGSLATAGLIASMTVNGVVVLRTERKSWQVSMQPRSLTALDPTNSLCTTSAPTSELTAQPTTANSSLALSTNSTFRPRRNPATSMIKASATIGWIVISSSAVAAFAAWRC
jgi:hypothetical protein